MGDRNSKWINDGEAIQNYFRDRFCSIYKSANPRIPSSLKELIQACITKEENEDSCRIPVGDEIKKVKWSMNPLKAPGSNGFPRLFYKHYWDEIRGLVILAVQSFYRYGWILKELNQTFITLILKSKGACNFNQFGSISLCKVCYKIIAKILVNRLRPLLGLKLEPAQVAFVPNRWIIENVILAQELIHNFKRTKKKKSFSYQIGFNQSI